MSNNSRRIEKVVIPGGHYKSKNDLPPLNNYKNNYTPISTTTNITKEKISKKNKTSFYEKIGKVTFIGGAIYGGIIYLLPYITEEFCQFLESHTSLKGGDIRLFFENIWDGFWDLLGDPDLIPDNMLVLDGSKRFTNDIYQGSLPFSDILANASEISIENSGKAFKFIDPANPKNILWGEYPIPNDGTFNPYNYRLFKDLNGNYVLSERTIIRTTNNFNQQQFKLFALK